MTYPVVRYPGFPRGAPGVVAPVPKQGIPKGADINITGDTASVVLDANAGGVSLGTAATYVGGATARVDCVPYPSDDVYLDDSDIEIDGDTVVAWVNTYPGKFFIGEPTIPGDRFADPIFATGPTGSVTTSASATVEDDEPVTSSEGGSDITGSIWINFRCYSGGTLTFTGSTESSDYRLEIFSGEVTTFDELSAEEEINYTGGSPDPPVLTVDVAAGDHLLRVGTFSGLSVDIDWLYTEGTQASSLGVFLIDPVVPQAPATVTANIVGFTAGESITFEVVGYGTQSVLAADGSGNIYGASIPIPEVDAGTYIIQAYGDSGSTSTTVQVTSDAATAPSTPSSDSGASVVAQPDPTVIKWILQDPVPGGRGNYIFPINPESMSSPHAPRNVVVDQLAAREGGQIFWESGYRAHEWQFSGVVLTEAFYEELVAYMGLNHRFFVIDHFERAWVVSFVSIGWEKMPDRYNDWAWRYTIQAVIYMGPLTPS